MQTAETRHLAKREKKYLANPHGRRHLKASLSESAKEFRITSEPKEQQEVRGSHGALSRDAQEEQAPC